MYKEMFTPEAMNILVGYVEDFNYFSKMIQINSQDLKDLPASDEEKRQYIKENRNRNEACYYCTQGFIERLSHLIGIKVKFEYDLHHVKWGTWEGDLFYKTADIEYEE